MEEGGDWDRRNRLKTYEGLYSMSIRDFGKAATCFFDTMATFTSTELMDYRTFVKYACFCCVVALDRSDVKSKVSPSLPSLPPLPPLPFSLCDVICVCVGVFRSLKELTFLRCCTTILN